MSSKISDDFDRLNATGLIKSTDRPVPNLSTEQKAALNRKGNQFFNEGDVDSARRIFITTGYSDGLSRVGDFFLEKGSDLDALKMYWLAHNRRKADPLIKKIAIIIETTLLD